MEHKLPSLPYSKDSLEPYISRETFEYHYEKHHQAYVTNLNKLTEGTEFEGESLHDIVRKSSGDIFNNSAQVWNHSFFWSSMKPDGGGAPRGELASAIEKKMAILRRVQEGLPVLGSGQLWFRLDMAGQKKTTGRSISSTPIMPRRR